MSLKTCIGKARDRCAHIPVIGGILKPKETVAVVRLSGVIADTSMRKNGISFVKTERMIKNAFAVYNVKAVALVINSPGGSPAQSELIANHIRAEADKHDVPVYAFVEDVAASGGYWLACAADKIYAAETSITGSIGVISASFGFSELIDQYGIERRIHTSGKDKGFLDPFLKEKASDVKRLKTLQSDLHQSFINWVTSRRGKKIKGDDKDVFEGAFWTSQTALDLGIIDGIGTVHDICRDTFGDNVKFVDFAPDRGLIASLVGSESKMTETLPEQILNLIESRSLWARFGL